MATVRSGVPGHDNGTAFVRLRRRKLVDPPSGQRVWDSTIEGPTRSSARGVATIRAGTGQRSRKNCAESGASTVRRRGLRPHLWITSPCRRANSHKGARSGHRTVESVTRDPALSIMNFIQNPS